MVLPGTKDEAGEVVPQAKQSVWQAHQPVRDGLVASVPPGRCQLQQQPPPACLPVARTPLDAPACQRMSQQPACSVVRGQKQL